MSTEIVHTTLHKDMALSKKLARWATKVFSEEMKKEGVRTCEVLVLIIAAATSSSPPDFAEAFQW
jgi:hypothetical protein